MTKQNYYSILNTDRYASGDQIHRAYRRLAQRLHPDVTNDPDGESKFKVVNEAYRTLRYPNTRAAYDQLTSHDDDGSGQDWMTEPFQAWRAGLQWLGWTYYTAR